MNCNERLKDYLDGYSSQYNFKDENGIEHDLNNDIEEILKQNQELKKQLEEINKFKFSYRKDETKIPPIIRKQKDVEIIKNLKNQQKDFINYLEDESKEIYRDGGLRQNIFKQILQKYKSIIGVSDDKTN